MSESVNFSIGDAVYLRGAPFGTPGRVLRLEHRRIVILWADLGPTYIGRHRPESLELAPAEQSKQSEAEVMP